MQQHGDPRRASSAIAKLARKRWTDKGNYVDDITALVVKLRSPKLLRKGSSFSRTDSIC